jgi:hypothetical protein
VEAAPTARHTDEGCVRYPLTEGGRVLERSQFVVRSVEDQRRRGDGAKGLVGVGVPPLAECSSGPDSSDCDAAGHVHGSLSRRMQHRLNTVP